MCLITLQLLRSAEKNAKHIKIEESHRQISQSESSFMHILKRGFCSKT